MARQIQTHYFSVHPQQRAQIVAAFIENDYGNTAVGVFERGCQQVVIVCAVANAACAALHVLAEMSHGVVSGLQLEAVVFCVRNHRCLSAAYVVAIQTGSAFCVYNHVPIYGCASVIIEIAYHFCTITFRIAPIALRNMGSARGGSFTEFRKYEVLFGKPLVGHAQLVEMFARIPMKGNAPDGFFGFRHGKAL